MNTATTSFDFHNLPDESELEAVINSLSHEETLSALNTGRAVLSEAKEPPELQVRAGVMLARRLRAMRESKNAVSRSASAAKKAEKEPKVKSLRDLLKKD